MKENMFAGADKLLFGKAAKHRRQQTFAEQILWNYLRTKPQRFKFRRQHPYLNYILDFYCHSLHLAIEVNGSIHEIEEVKQNDEERQRQLEENGLSVLRFKNDEIKLKPEEAIKTIEQHLQLKVKLNKKNTTA